MTEMMSNFLKKIFILTGFALLLPGFSLASNIEITPVPVFDAENLIPGDEEESTVTIKNNSDNDYESITLGGKRDYSIQTYDLAEVIELRAGDETINLADFLDGETITLSNEGIKKNEEKSYQFAIEFQEGSGNEYQDKEIVFDFVFTFRGTKDEEEGEEVVEVITTAGTGSVAFRIFNESIEEIGEDTATITWSTNRTAFGRVIYDTSPGQFDFEEGEPSYGYTFFTPRTEERVSDHSVTITGLMPGTTYYYRSVAYSSLAITVEREFITSEEGIEETIEEEIVEGVEDVRDPERDAGPDRELPREITEEEFEEEVIGVEDEREVEPVVVDPESEPRSWGEKLGATIGALDEMIDYSTFIWYLLLILFLLFLIFFLKRRKEKEEEIEFS